MAENSDYNDLAQKKGLKAVKEKITSALDAGKGRPFGSFICKWPEGVYRLTKTDEDQAPELVFQFSALEPLGIARTEAGQRFSLVCRMMDLDRHEKTIIFSHELLQKSSGEEARILFSSQGGYFAPGIRARTLLTDYVNSILHHARRALPRLLLVNAPGWYWKKDRCVYATYSKIYGSLGSEDIILNPPSSGAPDNSTKGTLADYQHRILRLAIGNSRLAFGLALSLAGPLLRLLGAEGGGFLLLGLSGDGKTTALRCAASVKGQIDSLVLSFNLSPTFFETAGLQANDGTFYPDEIGQARAGQIGSMAYQAGNGAGAGRGKTDGSAREIVRYRSEYLTTGERSASSIQSEAHLKYFEGQELRLLTVPADAGQGMGVFENLHEFDSAAALANHLNSAVKEHYGVLLDAYLEKLTSDMNAPPRRAETIAWLHEVINHFCKVAVPPGAAAQVARAARRFALVACAGELATN